MSFRAGCAGGKHRDRKPAGGAHPARGRTAHQALVRCSQEGNRRHSGKVLRSARGRLTLPGGDAKATGLVMPGEGGAVKGLDFRSCIMSHKTLQVAHDGAVATITLNRPDKRNAISYGLIEDLLAAFDEVAKSTALVLILTGAGQAFCSGMDLENLQALIGRSPEQSLEDSEIMARLFRTLYDFPKPTIAAVNGAAIAGGTGLATLCDFTLAVPEARFGYTEVRIGFVPAIVSSFLIRQVGEKIARDLLLTGRIFDAPEAQTLGLVTEIVAPDQLLHRAHQLATQLMENSPASLRATKRLLSSYSRELLDQRVALAVQENAAIRQTADFKEGITAFLEKRKPRWTGK